MTGPPEGSSGDLVVCSLEAWDEVWRRNQFLIRELLALDPHRRVLFVEPPFDAVHEARRRSARERQHGLRPLPEEARVLRFEPRKLWPNRAGPLADRALRRQVREAAAAAGLADPVLWVNDASYAGLAAETGWPSLYDITDDWTRAGDGDRSTRRILDHERVLFAESDRVVVCSPDLAASRGQARPDLVVIPNGVDVDHLQRPRPRPGDLPAAPTAVYVGTLHEDRLDVDLVAELARARPELAVTLVGPDALNPDSHRRLGAPGNVHRLGARPYRDVPAYLQHADVVIVPHVVSPFTESLDPIKAYECLAVGRTTVATPVAGFRDLPEPIRVAADGAFVSAVLDAVDVPSALAPGRPATWGERGAAFDQELRRARSRRVPTAVHRVVFVDHCAELSGGELALAQLLPALHRVEARVILGQSGPAEGLFRDTGAAVEVLPLDDRLAGTRRQDLSRAALDPRRLGAAAAATLRLARRLRQLRPDLVHTNSLKAAVYGGMAGRLAGVPVVWHLRDRIAPDYLPSGAVPTVRALARVLPRAIVANSQATLDTIGPGPGDQARIVVHDAVSDRPARPRRAHDGFRVAMVGRLASWKGQHVFLEALARAFGDEPFEAVVVGGALFGADEDDYERELADSIATTGLAGRVTMVGFVPDVADVLAGVDCLVHASVIPEPFGQVVLEGMAAGLAVIAAAGGPSEIITDGVDGLLYEPGDAVELARLLRLVAADPRLRERLGAAAQIRARRFSPERSAAAIEALYDRVARPPEAPAAEMPEPARPNQAAAAAVVHVPANRTGRGLIRAWRRGAPLVIDGGDLDDGRGPRRLLRRGLWRTFKPVVVVDSPLRRRTLGSIPSVVVPGGSWAARPEAGLALDALYRRLARADGPRFLAVDGRYATRPMTGVERVADRMVAHLPGPVAVFAPSARWSRGLLGHLWEQTVLPLRLLPYRARLWSPCNFGPMVLGDQIVTIHDVAPIDRPEWFSRGYRLWARVQWWVLYRRAATITVVSAFTRDRLAARWGPRPGVHVIANGADRDPGPTPAPDQPPHQPTDQPTDHPGPTVCVVGSLEPRKNLSTLLAAMAQVRVVHPTCRLVVIGELGDLRVFASSSEAELDHDWIDRLGRISDDELHRVVASSSTLAYISRYEGFGLPPLDAMAVGTPVVASDIPAIAEIAKGAAVLVDPSDVGSVAAGIVTVLSWSDRERAAAITRGRRRAARYTWARAAASLDAVVWPP